MDSGSESADPDEVAAFSATQASVDARSPAGFAVARNVIAGLPVDGQSVAPVIGDYCVWGNAGESWRLTPCH